MPRKNPHRSVVLTEELMKSLNKYAAKSIQPCLRLAPKGGENYVFWSKDFKAARSAVNNDKDIARALELYAAEAAKGNALAKYEIADLYRRGLVYGEAEAGDIYAQALQAFTEIEAANIVNLLRASLAVLRNAQGSTNRALSEMSYKVFGRGDLSKEAIAELLYRLQDKQNTAEM